MLQYTFDISTFEYFLLILVRISCFVFVAPFFGAKEVPGRVKDRIICICGNSCFLCRPGRTYSIHLGSRLCHIGAQRGNYRIADRISRHIFVIPLFYLQVRSLIWISGFPWLWYLTRSTGSQVSITGNLYSYFILLLLIVSNMHQYILRALIDSFQLFPLGGAQFQMDSLLAIHGAVLYGSCLSLDFVLFCRSLPA